MPVDKSLPDEQWTDEAVHDNYWYASKQALEYEPASHDYLQAKNLDEEEGDEPVHLVRRANFYSSLPQEKNLPEEAWLGDDVKDSYWFATNQALQYDQVGHDYVQT